MLAIWRVLRSHLHFLLVALVLTIIMTWPTVVHVFDSEVFWLPTNNWDAFSRIWEVWHLERTIGALTSHNLTGMLFYPVGMSLDFYPYNLAHSLLFALFKLANPVSNAFNLTYLTIIIMSVFSGYIFLNYLFGDRWLALFGAVIFGFSQHVVGHAHHPELGLIATLPLALYALHRGILQVSLKWMSTAGALIGLTALIGMYVFLFLLLTVGILLFYFALSRWRRTGFWIGLAVMLVIAGSISMVRIFPMLQDQGSFGAALAKNAGEERANDLLASFVNYRHAVTTPLFVETFNIDTY